MRYLERQAKIEDAVFEAIEEIAGELELNVPFYPEVYWLGRSCHFEDLFLPEKFGDEINQVSKNKSSIYLRIPRIILVSRDSPDHISEESAHFLHLLNSRPKLDCRNRLDYFSLNVLVEMLGFFCSKLVCPERKNQFARFDDPLLPSFIAEGDFTKKIAKLLGDKNYDRSEFLIHQQGYILGEKLYFEYVSGRKPLSEIKNLFFNRFLQPYEPTRKFMELKFGVAV